MKGQIYTGYLPRQRWTFLSTLVTVLAWKSMARLGNSCLAIIINQLDRAWRILIIIMCKYCTIQCCEALRDLPRKTHSCQVFLTWIVLTHGVEWRRRWWPTCYVLRTNCAILFVITYFAHCVAATVSYARKKLLDIRTAINHLNLD
jgi:hypothetical protein